MPSGNPHFGEIWSILDASSGREVQGIIADLNNQIVTLVSFTGARFRVSPARMSTWRFVRSPPAAAPQCERRGCSHPGFLRYHHQDRWEYACPRHLPVGVQAEVVTTGVTTYSASREVIPCPSCHDADPYEDVRIGALERNESGWWTCRLCNYRWGMLGPPPSTRSPTWLRERLEEFFRVAEEHSFVVSRIEIASPLWHDFVQMSDAFLGEPLPTGQMNTFRNVMVTEIPRLDSGGSVLLHLRGGPTTRPEPRRGIQRLGGQPNREGVVTGGERQHAMTANFGLLYGGEAPRGNARLRPAARPAQQEEHLPPIPEGSRWVQRRTGELIEVVACERTRDNTLMVRWRKFGEDSSTTPMLQRDFLRYHTPYEDTVKAIQKEMTTPTAPTVVVTPGEEWESVNGDGIIVIEVDARKEVVHAEDMASRRGRTIPLSEFAGARWRKIVRKNLFERLLEDEDG